MQKLSQANEARLNVWLVSDRQWKKAQRIGYARKALQFAHAAENVEDIAFWRAVVRANQ